SSELHPNSTSVHPIRSTPRVASARGPPGHRLVRPQADHLDPHGTGRCGGDPLQSKAPAPVRRPPPPWTARALGKRTSIERFFGRVFSLFGLFCLQRPALVGWSAITARVALTYAAIVVVGLAAQQAGRPDLIRSPKRVLAQTWEGLVE